MNISYSNAVYKQKNKLKISQKAKMHRTFTLFIILTFINTFSILGHDINYQFTSISIAGRIISVHRSIHTVR